MNRFKRVIIFLTFLVSCGAIVLLCVAAGTEHWIESEARRVLPNVTVGPQEYGQFEGKIHFGLFKGEKDLNFYAGNRKKPIWIVCLPSENVCLWSDKTSSEERLDYIKQWLSNVTTATNTTNHEVKSENEKDSTFVNFPLWVATIIFLALSVVFGITAAVFSVVNSITTPIEAITGVIGLYMWNGIALLFNLICVLLWVIQYYTKFKDNVMNAEERHLGWNSKGMAKFGYSFWLALGAMFLYAFNGLLIFISTMEQDKKKRTVQTVNEKPADGIVMLF